MFPETKRTKERDCPVCYAAHDEEIHQATLRLRQWFRHYVTRTLVQEDCFAEDETLATARVA